MPAKPVLSENDKKSIRNRLESLCEQCWIEQGYKKTSIKSLCDKAGISIGTFYALYPTKEDLFLATIAGIQERLGQEFLAVNRQTKSKVGFANSLKKLFREYDSKPFLYDTSTADFQAFAGKLPAEALQKLKFANFDLFRQSVQAAQLRLKLNEANAYGILSALLSTISSKKTLAESCDYLSVFDFMVDSLVPNMFD